MQRRQFITATAVAATSPTLTFAASESSATIPAPFVVKGRESRFAEKTKLFGTSPNDIKVSAKDTGNMLSVLEYNGREKGGPPLHIHPSQDEIFYVMEGNYLFVVGAEHHKLTTGDLIFLPRNVPHTFAQLTDTGRMVFFLQPGGKMEDYFRKLGTLTAQPSPQEGAKLFTDHDMQVVGPPLTID